MHTDLRTPNRRSSDWGGRPTPGVRPPGPATGADRQSADRTTHGDTGSDRPAARTMVSALIAVAVTAYLAATPTVAVALAATVAVLTGLAALPIVGYLLGVVVLSLGSTADPIDPAWLPSAPTED